VDRNVAQTQTRPLEEYLSDYVYAQPRFILLVASVGLALVGVGVYSVIAYTVSRQTREIGIRVALGASGGSVIDMVLGMGLRLIAIGLAVGLAVGLAASLALNRVLESELFGDSAQDPVTYVGVVMVVVCAGIAACWIPAQRATRVDPVVALRFE
jgi:putative ABC transport system permease protein